MKKLIQIALILILVCVLFQTAADGSLDSASKSGSHVVSDVHLTAKTDTANMQMAACLVRIKGVICVTPNVGWNT